jgi:hypothetical protein
MAYDRDAIRLQYPLSEILPARYGVALKKSGREFAACCPFHNEDGPSFTVFVGKEGHELFNCFGCGAKGDVFEFVARYSNRRNKEDFRAICQEITGETDIDHSRRPAPIAVAHFDPYAGFTFGMPPADAPAIEAGQRTPELRNPKHEQEENRVPNMVRYTPSMVFPYRDRVGRLIGYVLRIETDKGKITPGIWWMERDGWAGWCHGSYPAPRPLYGLDQLADHPEWQVIVTEGEKAADAARRLFAGKAIVVASWIGGTQAVSRADWTPLAGRKVVVWPDADHPGIMASREIASLCHKAGAAEIKVIEVAL